MLLVRVTSFAMDWRFTNKKSKQAVFSQSCWRQHFRYPLWLLARPIIESLVWFLILSWAISFISSLQHLGILWRCCRQGRRSHSSWGVMTPTFRGNGGQGTKWTLKTQRQQQKISASVSVSYKSNKKLSWCWQQARRRFYDIRLQKISWPWNGGQRSLKVIESGIIR